MIFEDFITLNKTLERIKRSRQYGEYTSMIKTLDKGRRDRVVNMLEANLDSYEYELKAKLTKAEKVIKEIQV